MVVKFYTQEPAFYTVHGYKVLWRTYKVNFRQVPICTTLEPVHKASPLIWLIFLGQNVYLRPHPAASLLAPLIPGNKFTIRLPI